MKDELRELQRQVSELSRNTAGLPVRYASTKSSTPDEFVTVEVNNVSGDKRRRGDVLQLGDYLPDPFDEDDREFEGDVPSTPATERIAILLEELEEGETGTGQMLGVCAAWVNVTDISHTHATSAAGEFVLSSATSGEMEILSLSEIDGTGEQELIVLIGGGGGGTGTGKKTAIVKATGTVPAATDSGGVRTAGVSSAFDVKIGDDISGLEVENWSITPISTDSYLAITEVIEAGESHYVIYNAFC